MGMIRKAENQHFMVGQKQFTSSADHIAKLKKCVSVILQYFQVSFIYKAVHSCLRKGFLYVSQEELEVTERISLLIDPEKLPDMFIYQLQDLRLPVRFSVAKVDPCGNGQA